MAKQITYRPVIEALEAREVPAAFRMAGDVLTITGNRNANVIEITDDGTKAAGNVTVNMDGVAYVAPRAVKKIVVRAGSGDDQVTYRLSGDVNCGCGPALTATQLAKRGRTVTVELGQGNDRFEADLGGHAVVTRLALSVYGGAGDDGLAVHALGSGVSARGLFAANLYGDAGNDAIDAQFSGRADGTLFVNQDGGNGGDELTGNVTADAGSEGGGAWQLMAGTGDDTVSLTAEGVAGFHHVLANGGKGTDTGSLLGDGVTRKSLEVLA